MQSIYALSDPRTDEIRYIGVAQDVHQRYAHHLNDIPGANKQKDEWIIELKDAGSSPRLVIIETDVDKTMVFEREAYWIQHYLSQGEKLTNILYGEHIGSTQGFLTLSQAAKRCVVTEKTLRRWIHAGKLKASTSGDRYLINPEDLDALLYRKSPEWLLKSQIEAMQKQIDKLEADVAMLKARVNEKS